MSEVNRKFHWENVYTSKGEAEVSWFQEKPAPSLELIAALSLPAGGSIIDVGGGASRLVDVLIERNLGKVTVLDVSAAALDAARKRLGDRGGRVTWIAADVTNWKPAQAYDVWHDRAAFHFLTEPADQSAYITCLKQGVRPGGYVIIGTFALDGPEKCSGLPIVRYDAASLSAALGPGFELIDTRRHDHLTPWGALQRFQFSTFRRK